MECNFYLLEHSILQIPKAFFYIFTCMSCDVELPQVNLYLNKEH